MLFTVGKVGVSLLFNCVCVCVLGPVAMVFMCLLFETTCCNGIHSCLDGVCSSLDLLFNIRYVLPKVCKKLLKMDS